MGTPKATRSSGRVMFFAIDKASDMLCSLCTICGSFFVFYKLPGSSRLSSCEKLRKYLTSRPFLIRISRE